jgi:hypothetical protein
MDWRNDVGGRGAVARRTNLTGAKFVKNPYCCRREWNGTGWYLRLKSVVTRDAGDRCRRFHLDHAAAGVLENTLVGGGGGEHGSPPIAVREKRTATRGHGRGLRCGTKRWSVAPKQ